MSFQNRLLLYHFLITIGYSIASLATFLSIESTFNSLEYLGVALSLRTLSSCIVGYKANFIIQKLNIRNSFVLGLALGLIALTSIFYGFHYHNFIVVVLGIILVGLPFTITSILLTVTFRYFAEENTLFRKYSGSRELMFGIARISACLLVPFLLIKFDIKTILLLNAVIYAICIFIVLNIDLTPFIKDKLSIPAIQLSNLIFKSKDMWIYICQIFSAMFLIALVPLLASSGKIAFTKEIPQLMRQSLWSIEAFTMILSSAIYLIARKVRGSEVIKTGLMLNSIFLFMLLFVEQPYMVIMIVMFISTLMMLSFNIFRDDFVIRAGSDHHMIEAYAAFSSVMKDIISSISPVILTYLFSTFKLNMVITMIFMIQFVCYLAYVFLVKNKSREVELRGVSI